MLTFEKYLLITKEFLITFAFGITLPIIDIYFMKMISVDVLGTAQIISTILCSIVLYSLSLDKVMKFYKKHILPIMIADISCYIGICYFSVSFPIIRFVGVAVVGAVSTNIWIKVMRSHINNTTSGDKLTKFQLMEENAKMVGNLLGSMALFVLKNYINVEIALGIQCILIVIDGICDFIAMKMMEKRIDEEKEAI